MGDTVQNKEIYEQELMNTTSNNSGFCYGREDAPFRTYVIELFTLLQDIGTGISSEASKLQSDLLSMTGVTSNIRSNLSTADWVFTVALAIAIIQMVITIFLVSGVLLAWMQRYPKPFRCVQSYVLLPFFVCMVFLSALFSCIFVCVSVVGSDFCFGDPDSKVVAALEMMDFNSVAFNLVAFYIKGCSGMVLPKILENITDVLNDGAIALNFTHNFID